MAQPPDNRTAFANAGCCCALLALATMSTGCTTIGASTAPQPKSVGALYQEAVVAAGSIPDSRQATLIAKQQRNLTANSDSDHSALTTSTTPPASAGQRQMADPKTVPTTFNPSARSPRRQNSSAGSSSAGRSSNTVGDLRLVSLQQLPSITSEVDAADRSIELIQRLEAIPLPNAKRVSDIFEETDIHQAILSLAAQAEVDVLIDDEVSGSSNAVIEDEAFDRALEQLLLPLGLVSRFDGKRYLIGVPNPESSLFHLIAEQIDYAPRHLAPADLKELLPDRLSKFIRIVEKRNLVIIEAPGETASRIAARLEELDQPVPQVELEAIICVVSPESGFRFGLDWGHTVKLGGDDVLNLGMSALSGSTALTPFGVRNAFDDFAVTSAFVRLLAQEGYLTIRAAPRVMAKDGEKASISIARETFFSVQPSNADVLFRQDIEKVEAGIGLEIIPIVRGDKITVLIEKAEVSEDIRTNNSNSDISNNPFPLINRRTVTTTVDVRDGETIVIGGLMQQQTVDQVVRVPYLSRMPFFGKMFQTIEKREQDAEVAVFISPRIVKPHTSAPSMDVMELYNETN